MGLSLRFRRILLRRHGRTVGCPSGFTANGSPNGLRMATTKNFTAVGLFAGSGGIELGLKSAGIGTELLCEIDPGAGAVLEKRFGGIPIHRDIRTKRSLPKVDLVAGGCPSTLPPARFLPRNTASERTPQLVGPARS